MKERPLPATETPAQRLGRLIRNRRYELGREKWTQQYLADITGMAQTTISAWETGKVQRPRMVQLSKIANALDIDLSAWMNLPDMSDVAAYIEELRDAHQALGDLTGPRAEIARLLPELPEDEAERLLSNVHWILDRLKAERVKARGSGGGTTGGQKSQKKKGFTALQLPTTTMPLSIAPALS